MQFSEEDEKTIRENNLSKPWRNESQSLEQRTKLHKLLARHILQEKTRLGGNLVVSFSLESRFLRNVMREILGTSTIFIVFEMDEALQNE